MALAFSSPILLVPAFVRVATISCQNTSLTDPELKARGEFIRRQTEAIEIANADSGNWNGTSGDNDR